MKYLSYCLFLIFVCLASCKPNPVEKLSGKWAPVDAMGAGVTEENKKDFIEQGNMMEFTKDGKFITFSIGMKNDTGTYALSEDGRTLKVNTANGRQTQFSINELKRNRTILENQGMVLVLEPVK